MSAKHTPGPWKAIGAEVYEDRPGGDFLCEVDRRTLGRPDPENQSNARLIAAAPELLEALERIAKGGGVPAQIARAAILKARGGK